VTDDDPHGNGDLVTAGAPLSAAEAAVVAVHGRGATAEGIVNLVDDCYRHGVAFLAPQADRSTWYPNSFVDPVETNEPRRRSALRAVDRTVERAVEAGLSRERVLLLGFSQGACIAADYVARNPTRYGGLAVLSGGLIGERLPDDYAGDLERTPVFLGCSEGDPYIPEARVHDSAAVFADLNADVTVRIYDGDDHRVTDDELARLDAMVAALVGDRA
jgi:phospholipase/carboxylesterase